MKGGQALVDPFRPKVVDPTVIRLGRRYSLVHTPGLYLINDNKQPAEPPERFSDGDRALALGRYRQLEHGRKLGSVARKHPAGGAGVGVRRARARSTSRTGPRFRPPIVEATSPRPATPI